ncbi:hypothetical protein [Pseudomonas sp. MWU12-3091]|uniref:hypothetical protein n=1 Tax=Pseudomonas sp. MWU12-3091 TaxID=2929053 RepID=UPI00200EAE9D|nr:hypothetical protein [Pseudomonas sp. MWU12-3091]
MITGVKLQVFVTENEARLLGTPSAFSTVSRAIRKCKVGTSIHLPLESSRSPFTSLEIRCTAGSAVVAVMDGTLLVAYPEKLRRRLSPYFAMPAETPSGSTFFINASQIDVLHDLTGESLQMILQVVGPDQV